MRKNQLYLFPASYDGSFRSALVGQFLMASRTSLVSAISLCNLTGSS